MEAISIETIERSGSVSRREFLRIGLATATLVVVAGCGSLRRKSDLDKAYQNLQNTLNSIAKDDAEQARLASLSQRIVDQCRALTKEHDEFRRKFDALSRQRDTKSTELDGLVDSFKTRRTQHRDAILRLQDDLRRELTEEEWTKAVEVLNEKAAAFKRSNVGSG